MIGLDGQMIVFLLIGTLFHLHLRGRLTTRAGAMVVALAFGCFVWLWSRGPLTSDLVPGIISYSAALLLFTTCYVRRSHIRVHARLSWLADISYPLYVAHAMPGYAIIRLLLAAGANAWVGIALAVTWSFASAAFIHRMVEVPTRELGRRLALTRTTDLGSVFDRRHHGVHGNAAPPRILENLQGEKQLAEKG